MPAPYEHNGPYEYNGDGSIGDLLARIDFSQRSQRFHDGTLQWTESDAGVFQNLYARDSDHRTATEVALIEERHQQAMARDAARFLHDPMEDPGPAQMRQVINIVGTTPICGCQVITSRTPLARDTITLIILCSQHVREKIVYRDKPPEKREPIPNSRRILKD